MPTRITTQPKLSPVTFGQALVEDVPRVEPEAGLDHEGHAHAVEDQAGEELGEPAAETAISVANRVIAATLKANSRGAKEPIRREVAMTTSVRGGQLARLLGQWHSLPGRHRSPDYAALAAAVRGLLADGRLPLGRPPAGRAGAGRGARGQPHHGDRRLPGAARDRPPDQPARRRQLDHAAERAPGGHLRPVGRRTTTST